MNTANWGDFVKGVSARIDEIIDETKDLAPSFMQTGLWKKEQADGLIFRTEGVTGFSLLEEKDEDGKLKEDRTYPAYKTEYVIKETGKIVSISQLLMKTRPAELEAKLDEIRQLRISADRTNNKWAWQILIDGFGLTDSGFPISRLDDGVALYSNAHPSKVAGVANRSNLISGNPSLSPTSLFTGIKMLKEMLNGRGLPISPEGNFVLVVPTALEKTGAEITKSTKVSQSADNDINYYQGLVDMYATNLIGSAAGGSDTAWYLFHKSDIENSLRYVALIEPKIEKTIDFDTKAIKISIDQACAFGYSNFEHTVASNGTNA